MKKKLATDTKNVGEIQCSFEYPLQFLGKINIANMGLAISLMFQQR